MGYESGSVFYFMNTVMRYHFAGCRLDPDRAARSAGRAGCIPEAGFSRRRKR